MIAPRILKICQVFFVSFISISFSGFSQRDESTTIYFYVQIGAYENRLPNDHPILLEVFKRGENYEVIRQEDERSQKLLNYYLVPLGGTTDRDEAIQLRSKLDIEGAFIVPTIQKKKIDISSDMLRSYLARQNKGLEIQKTTDPVGDNYYDERYFRDKTSHIEPGMKNKPTYYLQIGAFLSKKKKSDIEPLIEGYEQPVIEKYLDGFYKYFVNPASTRPPNDQLKKNVKGKIPDAFVVKTMNGLIVEEYRESNTVPENTDETVPSLKNNTADSTAQIEKAFAQIPDIDSLDHEEPDTTTLLEEETGGNTKDPHDEERKKKQEEPTGALSALVKKKQQKQKILFFNLEAGYNHTLAFPKNGKRSFHGLYLGTKMFLTQTSQLVFGANLFNAKLPGIHQFYRFPEDSYTFFEILLGYSYSPRFLKFDKLQFSIIPDVNYKKGRYNYDDGFDLKTQALKGWGIGISTDVSYELSQKLLVGLKVRYSNHVSAYTGTYTHEDIGLTASVRYRISKNHPKRRGVVYLEVEDENVPITQEAYEKEKQKQPPETLEDGTVIESEESQHKELDDESQLNEDGLVEESEEGGYIEE